MFAFRQYTNVQTRTWLLVRKMQAHNHQKTSIYHRIEHQIDDTQKSTFFYHSKPTKPIMPTAAVAVAPSCRPLQRSTTLHKNTLTSGNIVVGQSDQCTSPFWLRDKSILSLSLFAVFYFWAADADTYSRRPHIIENWYSLYGACYQPCGILAKILTRCSYCTQQRQKESTFISLKIIDQHCNSLALPSTSVGHDF